MRIANRKPSGLRIDDARVGDKVLFEREKQRYTVQAIGGHFLVCTKPFNLRKTVFYCIIDLAQRIRGPENLVFGMGAETREECEAMISRLTHKDDSDGIRTEVSHRHRIALDVVRVDRPKVAP